MAAVELLPATTTVPLANTVVPLENVTLDALPDETDGAAAELLPLSVNVSTREVRKGDAPEEVGVIVCTSVVVVTMSPAEEVVPFRDAPDADDDDAAAAELAAVVCCADVKAARKRKAARTQDHKGSKGIVGDRIVK